MAYQCKQLSQPDWFGNQNCQQWVEVGNASSTQSLAISKVQAFELSGAIALVWVSAWAIRQIINLIRSTR